MRLLQIYQCLCDETRLRILNLLAQGPLCVCHFQDILNVPQARVSQHLSYLRKRGMVESTRRGTWMIYSLPARPSTELEKHLQCLQDCVLSEKLFRDDLKKLRKANPNVSPANSCNC